MIQLVKAKDNLDYFDSAEDTPSIISIRIKNPANGAWMVKAELAKVFKAMTLDMSSTFPDYAEAKEICFTGQPVLISKEQAVLRIALGSDSLRHVIDDLKFNSEIAKESDRVIVDKMAFLANNFDKL